MSAKLTKELNDIIRKMSEEENVSFVQMQLTLLWEAIEMRLKNENYLS